MSFEQAMAEVKDTLVVMAEIQRRQAEVQKLQAHELDAIREGYLLHEKRMAHVDERLAEITDKLDGLIGYVQNLPKRPS